MADDTTRLVISVETLLKGLDKTLAGLSKVETQLKSIAAFKPAQATTAGDKAIANAQKLVVQQQKLQVQTQELANRQLKAQVTADRLALSQLRLEAAFKRTAEASARAARQTGQQADAHVKVFKAVQKAAIDADTHIKFFRANEAALKRAPQLDSHVQAFKAIQRSAQDANSHVLAFRASETALRRAPQLDAHIQAFRALEEGIARSNQRLVALGNAARSFGQGLTTIGLGLTAAITVPLVALGKASVEASVTLDSLKRGLTAITGSAEEANTQLTRLTEIAKLPGIGFEEAIRGSIRLQAVGFSALDAEKALKQFSNAVALTGGGRDELARITVQLGQLAAKGKVLSQDLRPIIEAAPAVGKALKQAFGTVNADDIAEMTTNSREFLDTLVAELERLPRAAGGARNSFENFRDSVFRASTAIGDALLPALIKIVEVTEPIITKLASVFRALPEPIQAAIVVVGVLAAAFGPIVAGVGILALGFGRLAVAVGQFGTQNIAATFSMRALTASMVQFNVAATATIARLTGLQAATIRAAGPWLVLAAAVGTIASVVLLAKSAQEELTAASEEQIKTTQNRIQFIEEEQRFLQSLQGGLARTSDEQQRLTALYQALDLQSRLRIQSIQGEANQTAALREELEKLAVVERERLKIQGLTIARQFIQDLEKMNELLAEQAKIERQIAIAGRTDTGVLTDIDVQIERHGKLNEELAAQRERLKQTGAQLKTYGEVSGESAENTLDMTRSLIGAETPLKNLVAGLKDYTADARAATEATNAFKVALDRATVDFDKQGEETEKRFDDIIDRIKRTTHSTEDAKKALQNYIQLIPQLQEAIERRRGTKTQEQFIGGLFDEKVTRNTGSSLRNAQVQLAKQMEDIAKADADRQVAITEQKNQQLLNANELAFSQQLRSYQEYLRTRAQLTLENLDKEIEAQANAAVEARKTQVDLLQKARDQGIPSAERVRRQSQAAEAQERAIKAETKLAELETRREAILSELQRTLAETAIQQDRDVKQLEIEYENLKGNIEEAFKAENLEQFREKLQELSREQLFLNELLKRTGITAEEKEVIKLKQIQNRHQIELIRNIVGANDALAAVKGSEQVIGDIKQRQVELERELDFAVRFRGLSEEEAINQRLAGEQKVRDAIDQQRARLEALAVSMALAGKEIPKALANAIEGLKVESLGLGELDFTERFRLAEKEFDKLNDARIQKIQDVERAVLHRDMAEIQGQIAIRRANNEYVAGLEAQLAVLQKIADESGDIRLQRQAADATQTVKDVRAAADELENFGTQLKSVGIDSFADSLSQLFKDLRDNTQSAMEDILNFLNNIINRVGDFVAEDLARQITEALFPDPNAVKSGGGGVIATIKKIFGIGNGNVTGPPAVAGTGVIGGALGGAKEAAATATLQAGAAAAGATLVTGATTASVTFSTAITTAGAAFAATIAAAGAAFAAAVAASAGAGQTVGFLGSIGGAATGLFPAVPGGLIRVVEGGYPEAVLTTDPKHAVRQAQILKEYLAKTKGLFGKFKIPEFASGGWAYETEMNILNSIERFPELSTSVPEAALSGRGDFRLRQIFVDDQRDVRNWINSPEGERVMVEKLIRNRPLIRKLVGGRN